MIELFFLLNLPIFEPTKLLNSNEVAIEEFPSASEIEVSPLNLQGPVGTFDPAIKAKQLVKSMPREWCGIYKEANYRNSTDVILNFWQLDAVGQIIDLRGELGTKKKKIKLQGILNAKSNQIELIALSDEKSYPFNLNSILIDIQGEDYVFWGGSRISEPFGFLELNTKCK